MIFMNRMFVRVEEQFNQLLCDPEIRKERYAQQDFVLEKLRARVEVQQVEYGIDDAARKEFIAADSFENTRLYQALQQHKTELSLSGRKLDEFRLCAKDAAQHTGEKNVEATQENRQAALKLLDEVLLSRAAVRFQKDMKLSTKVWKQFLNCHAVPKDTTLDKIRNQLALTSEEARKFNSLRIRSVFPVYDPLQRNEDLQLKNLVHKLRKSTGMKVYDFLSHALLGPDAWAVFYFNPRSRIKRTAPNTSQDTLLKLVVGFQLGEEDAKAFMRTARSAFVTRKDLLVLACIRCGCQDPFMVQEVIKHYRRYSMV